MNNINQDPLGTPVYLKIECSKDWPSDKMFYLMTRNGLFRCRNHPFFKSAIQVKDGPKELATQDNSLKLTYPKLPQDLVERAIGFFRLIAEKQSSEAAAIWYWNKSTQQVELFIPDQVASNSSPYAGNPHGCAMDVKYDIPITGPELVYIGDIHCHVDMSAFASFTDESDEVHRAGLHIIVGKIYDKRPQFYCDAVVDGMRFKVEDLSLIWEGFDQADTASVPKEWLDKVKLEAKKWKDYSSTSSYSYHDSTGYGSSSVSDSFYSHDPDKADNKDKDIMREVLAEFAKMDRCPLISTIRQELFHRTKHVSYLGCEAKAQKFIDNWAKIKKGHDESLIGKE